MQDSSLDRSEPDADSAALADLIAVMTHDLRSPLGAIGLFCELLQTSDPPLPEGQTRNIQLIADAAVKAEQILEDAAEMSRIYRSLLKPTMNRTDLWAVCREALEQAAPVLESRSARVDLQLPESEGWVTADQKRLLDVVLALLEKATPAASSGGEISIRGVAASNGTAPTLIIRSPGAALVAPGGSPLKGRLGGRRPGQSRYTLETAIRLMPLMHGSLETTSEGMFEAVLKPQSAA